MPRITVEKYVAGTLERRFAVPAFAITAAARWLPRSAIAGLRSRGLDIPAIVAARRSGTPYAASMEVTEGGVRKQVRVFVV